MAYDVGAFTGSFSLYGIAES